MLLNFKVVYVLHSTVQCTQFMMLLLRYTGTMCIILLNWTCKLHNFHYHLCHRFVLYTVSTYVYSINALYGVPGYGRSSRQPQPRIRPGILSLGILLLLSRKEKGRYSICTVQKTVPGIFRLGILLLLSRKEKGRNMYSTKTCPGILSLGLLLLLSRNEKGSYIK